MEQERTNWNDDRLDRLADQVDRLAGEVTALGRHMDDRFDRLQYSLIVALGGILAAFGGALVALQV
jgi:hypothetical protein